MGSGTHRFGEAAKLDKRLVAATEWPLFGSVFYLWSVESLQAAWERDRSLAITAPAEYARSAIQAAAALVIDPHHAAWVKKHWGDDYLHRENVFYRMLVIAALTSEAQLLGETRPSPCCAIRSKRSLRNWTPPPTES